MPRMSALQSFGTWHAACAVAMGVGIATHLGPNEGVVVVMSSVFWALFISAPTWFAWRFLRFVWRAASLISIRVEDRLNDVRRERAFRQ